MYNLERLEVQPEEDLPSIPTTPEAVLEVKVGADADEINRAYHQKSKLFHPDVNNNSEQSNAWMRAINIARDTLLNPKPTPPIPKRPTAKAKPWRAQKYEEDRNRKETRI